MQPADQLTPEERQAVGEVLATEYAGLLAALNANWSASLLRTSIYLISLSAAGVALGFAAQSGLDQPPFRALALVILPLLLFLGVATFGRLVQVQRESMIYNTGLNRIRYFFVETAPASRPYLVLPTSDDERALFRSIGTGMRRHPPRYLVLYSVVQTQGVVGVITAAVAAAFGGLAAAAVGGPTAAWIVAVAAFAVTLGTLFLYWQRSLAEIRASIEPIHPTPPDEVGVPF